MVNKTSPDISDLATMEIIIDGESVRRDEPGKPLSKFLEGNSLIGKGKVIAIMVAKEKTNETNKFSGSIHLRKT